MLQTGFCCPGCAYVSRLVHERGLAKYYELKDPVTAPADAAVLQPRDFEWLEAAQRDAERATPIPELGVGVQGISCAACVWLIERVFQQQPGARDVIVNAQYGTLRMRWVAGTFSAPEFARMLQTFGYLVGPDESDTEPESRSFVRRIGLCAAFTANAMLFSLPVYFGMRPSFEWAGLFGLLSMLFGTLSVLVGGSYFIGRAVRAAARRTMHIDLPIAIGIAGAYAGSLYGWAAGEPGFVYFDFVSTFILLMLVGRWGQISAIERNRRRLLAAQPRMRRVRLLAGGDLEPESLQAGQAIAVSPGQILPVEARLASALAQFSLASVSGEAEPRVFHAGQRVPSGAVNIGRADAELSTTQAWNDSLLCRLLRVRGRAGVEHAWLDRIVRGYVAGILFIALFSGIGWWIASGDVLRTGAIVTAVLVVSCPCAIGLAFPLADEMAAVALRRKGVFVRDGDLWAKLCRVKKLVFDKTGTLTLETPTLLNPEALVTLAGESRAALMALVDDNPHPIAESLRQQLLASGPVETASGEVIETVGYGVEQGPWSLGRPGWRAGEAGRVGPRDSACRPAEVTLPDRGTVHEHAVDRSPADAVASLADPIGASPGDAASPEPRGGADLLVVNGEDAVDAVLGFEGRVIARFRFADRPRTDALVEISALRKAGKSVFILSGDRVEKVKALAAELGLPADHAIGGSGPDEKAQWLGKNGADAAMMLGDGANDSLAFDRALCRGTPVVHRGTLENKADFYFLGRGIRGIRSLFEIDRIRRRTQQTILVFSVIYNVLAVGAAVAGWMNPLIAAILMPANSLLTLGLVTGGMRRAFATADGVSGESGIPKD